MKNKLYSGFVGQLRGQDDELYPCLVIVTEENNGYFVWLSTYGRPKPIAWFPLNREGAIEFAVLQAQELRRVNNYEEVGDRCPVML